MKKTYVSNVKAEDYDLLWTLELVRRKVIQKLRVEPFKAAKLEQRKIKQQ